MLVSLDTVAWLLFVFAGTTAAKRGRVGVQSWIASALRRPKFWI
jgi:hypothetical protein